jgi:hypothetical protein
MAALRVDLRHDPVDVILDGEFGQIQMRRLPAANKMLAGRDRALVGTVHNE